jgi:hypothetical protein
MNMMKKAFLASSLFLIGFTSHLLAGSILAPGNYDAKRLVTKLDHDTLRASSKWRMGDGEPPIGPGKAAGLALAAQKVQFPDFKDASVREVSLVSSPKGSYYRVLIWQAVDMDAVAEAGGRMKPNQMNYYVLLDSSVIKPETKD